MTVDRMLTLLHYSFCVGKMRVMVMSPAGVMRSAARDSGGAAPSFGRVTGIQEAAAVDFAVGSHPLL